MKILVLCTFPADVPRHGGQIRLRNIIDKYKSLGNEVVSAGVLGSGSYPKSKYYIEYPQDAIGTILKPNFCMEDYAIGKLLVTDELWYSKLVNIFPWQPDVIHVELPWMFEFAKKYVKSIGRNVPIIYGSENIEYKLKYSIMRNFSSHYDSERYANLVKAVELNAVKGSDACVAVSQDDLDWLKKQTSKHVYLAPNGVSQREITEQGEAAFKELKLPEKYVFYCGSSHMPNITGLYEMFQPALACVEPDQRLVVGGGCSLSIQHDEKFAEIPCFSQRTTFLGEVTEDLLASLLHHAHCIILPITSGQGTNLKTAEAIWTGCYVVGTRVSFRGFEEFMSNQGIMVADTGVEFRQFVRLVMDKEKNSCTAQDRNLRRKVLWSECLEGLRVCLSEIRS